MINNKYPTTKPSLNLDFANTKSLDPRITFRRGTPGTYYDGVTHAKAEENLLSYSEDFSVWSGTPTLLEPLAVGGASPIGTQAYKFIADTTPSSVTFGYLPLSKSELLTSYSIHVKADGFDYAWFGVCWDGSNYVSFVVDLVNGKVLDQYTRNRDNILIDADVLEVGNGWYRVKYVSDGYTANYMSIGGFFNPATDISSDGRPNFSGDGVSGILLWGAQVETRNAVTSYTATNGTPITKYQPKLMTAAADHARFDHDPITGESKGLLIEEQRTNLHRRSEDFVWGDDDSYQSTLISNSLIAPDGQLSATKVEYDPGATGGGYANGYRPGTSSGQILTGSMYFKEGSLSKVYCFFNIRRSNLSSLASYGVNVDLSQGSIVSQDTEITSSSIINAGNGWYRVSWSATMPAEAAKVGLSAYMYDTTISPSSYLDGFYIWGAQLEVGSFPTSYIKTTGASATRSADNASITGENFSSWYRQDEGSIYCDVNSLYNHGGTGLTAYSLKGEDDNYFISYSKDLNNFYHYVNSSSGGSFDYASATIESKAILSLSDGYISSYSDGETNLQTNQFSLFKVDSLYVGRNPVSNQNNINGHIKKLAYYPQRLTNEQLQNLTK